MSDPEHRDAITTAIYCRWAEDEARKQHLGLITGERGEGGALMIDTGSPDTEMLSSDPEEGVGQVRFATPLSSIKPATVDSESSQSPSLAGTGRQVASIQADQTGRTRTQDDSLSLLEDALEEATTSKRASPSDTRRVSPGQPKPPVRREILSVPSSSTSSSITLEPFKKLVKSIRPSHASATKASTSKGILQKKRKSSEPALGQKTKKRDDQK